MNMCHKRCACVVEDRDVASKVIFCGFQLGQLLTIGANRTNEHAWSREAYISIEANMDLDSVCESMGALGCLFAYLGANMMQAICRCGLWATKWPY